MLAPMFDMDGDRVRIGDRVEIGPHHDLWIMGAKYGRVHDMVVAGSGQFSELAGFN